MEHMGLSRRLSGPALAIAAVCAFALCADGPVWAQYHVNGTVTGTVTDTTGAVVPGASVTLINDATSVKLSAQSNEVGVYIFSDVAPATYTISIQKAGFENCQGTGLVLQPADTRTFSCALKVGTEAQTVSVSAGALQVQTETAQVNSVINSEQVQELPDNGRNFANFLSLQPGVAGINFDANNSMNIFATQGVAVNGQRDEDNNILIEGVSSQRTRDNAATTAAPALDAIGEINIVAAGYMPEYSRASGAQIIVQLKSGTDHYHGSLYEYNQNTVYDSAVNYIVPGTPVGPYNWNNFGGTFGGPIPGMRHKLFLFYSEDVTRNPGAGPNNVVVPSTNAHSGDFSDYCTAGIGCPKVPAWLAGKTDPNTGATLVQGQPFPNNSIAQSFWSPNGSALLGVYPNPNISASTVSSSANYYYSATSPNTNHTESLKVDHQIDRWKSHLAVSLRHYRTNSTSGSFGNSPQLLDWTIQEPERGGTIDFATTFTPTLVNDFTFGATEDIVHVVLSPGPRGNGLDRTTFGIDYPYIFGDASKDIAGKTPTINWGGPNSNMDSFNGDTDAYPSHSIGKIFQYSDVITKTKGRHVLKFGAWIEEDGEDDDDQLVIGGQNLNGTFSINGNSSDPHSTSLPVADLLLGVFDGYTELGYRNLTPWFAWQQGYFGQDSWKVTPNFTLQGGLRWDYFPNYGSHWCNFSMFNPLAYTTYTGGQQVIDSTPGSSTYGEIVGGNYYNGISVPCSQLPASGYGHFGVFGEGYNATSQAGINQALVGTGMMRGYSSVIVANHHKNFQPRVGFAWSPTMLKDTSIRGSVGVFYNHDTLSDQTQMGRNVPFQTAATVTNGDIDCPDVSQSPTSFGCGTSTSAFTPGPVVASPTNPQQPLPITGSQLGAPVPVVYGWQLSAQHMLPQDTLLQVGYVGNRSRHLSVLENLNEMTPGSYGSCLGAQGVQFSTCPYTYSSDVGSASTPVMPVSAVVPYPGFSNTSFTYQGDFATSAYDSLQASLQRRNVKNLMYTVAYTYANARDIGSELQSSIVDHYDPLYNAGKPDWLRHHVLNGTYVYTLPFFESQNDLAGAVLGGWSLTGVFSAQSGFPATVIDDGVDVAGLGVDPVGTTGAGGGASNGEHAELVQGCNPNSGPRTKAEWFKTSCYVSPTAPAAAGSNDYLEPRGTLGNSGRNTVWAPGMWIWDAGLHKTGFMVTEKLRYEFRAEAYNLLNHPVPNGIDVGSLDGAFGIINSVYQPTSGSQRNMQLGLRLIF
jgi:Carboxypeptidase regulatory-like domain